VAASGVRVSGFSATKLDALKSAGVADTISLLDYGADVLLGYAARHRQRLVSEQFERHAKIRERRRRLPKLLDEIALQTARGITGAVRRYRRRTTRTSTGPVHASAFP